MKSLNFFGSDFGFGEKNNSAYFELNDDLYIIDCGFTVFNEIKSKFDLSKYNEINVIITHLHNDHAGSLSQLILYAWFIFHKKINVISKCENIEKYLEITGTAKEGYIIKNELDNLKFIKTEHVIHLDAYGFVIDINDKKVVYTGDTNTLQPFMNKIIDSNELYVDVCKNGGDNHLQIDEILNELNKFCNDRN